jgi:hypothetical protein
MIGRPAIDAGKSRRHVGGVARHLGAVPATSTPPQSTRLEGRVGVEEVRRVAIRRFHL